MKRHTEVEDLNETETLLDLDSVSLSNSTPSESGPNEESPDICDVAEMQYAIAAFLANVHPFFLKLLFFQASPLFSPFRSLMNLMKTAALSFSK